MGRLSLLGLSDYLRYGVKKHPGVGSAEKAINTQYLSSLSLTRDSLQGKIDITEGGTDKTRLRQILERHGLILLEATPESRRDVTASARTTYSTWPASYCFSGGDPKACHCC